MHVTIRKQPAPDRGVSVVMVVISFAVLLSVVLTTSLYVVRSTRLAAAYTDTEKALSAAESGITDYFARASTAPGYWQETDCTNIALQAPVTEPVCGRDEHTDVGWAPVEDGADPETSPAYHYDVLDWDEANGTEAGWLTLRATGRSGSEYRSVEVRATRDSTAQYAGYQNHWVRGPTCTDANGARVYQRGPGSYEKDSATVWCLKTLGALYGFPGWAASGTSVSSSEVDWRLNSWVNPIEGDFFSNDIGFLNPGPISMDARYRVNGTVTVTNPWCDPTALSRQWAGESSVISASCGVLPAASAYRSNPASRVATTEEPQLSSSRTLPYDSALLEAAAGCRYYGPTRIVMEADGRMRVWSKQSVYTELAIAVPSASGTLPACGTPAELASADGASVPVPDGMVVYVSDLPAEVAADHAVANDRLDAHEIGGNALYGELPIGDVAADVIADPTWIEQDHEIWLDTSSYAASRYRTKGNLWVEGNYQGRVTLGSSGAVLITGDLTALGGTTADSTDQLGIVASEVAVVDQRVALRGRVTGHGENAWVGMYDSYHPYYRYIAGVDSASGSLGSWPHDYDGNSAQVRIDAAIQVLAGGLGYQDGSVCPLSPLVDNSADGWFERDHGMPPYFSTFPGVTMVEVPRTDNVYGKTYRAQVVDPADGSATREVLVTGSLAQNFLSEVGTRMEKPWALTNVGGPGSSTTVVAYPQASCGMDVTVRYDDRLRDSAPPYLLRFTDSGWERGDSSEVTTPEYLRP